MSFNWLADNYIEVFGAVTGIIYVFLEIRQDIWLWPVGIITTSVYIWVFFTSKIYADMSLQVYYLVISILGWYWWARKKERRKGEREKELLPEQDEVMNNGVNDKSLQVTRLKFNTGAVLAVVFSVIFAAIWLILSRYTDSPVPIRDSFVTSLSIVATWMLARKIYEHWLLWIIINFFSAVLFLTRGLYPTFILYIVYGVMSFAGLKEWKKSLMVN
ncbi:MAG TPA: nicotinamide riboside transporter PnuC [Bacteroidales bacterium]|nr:nicotinamide riboside transporter PnuC [Bacteroidales bacterium]HPT22558.1 nicotinamide riboside transporter PnuC [Bacteroidales bacterium]